jgi:hypothetical protein
MSKVNLASFSIPREKHKTLFALFNRFKTKRAKVTFLLTDYNLQNAHLLSI